jgi:dephospho-CoA kinase
LPPTATPNPQTAVYGVLGGIASGKSEVASLLAGPDGLILSADALAHEALNSPEVQAQLVAELGPQAVGEDGRSDRAWIAGRVFDDPAARALLESWIHPRVRERITAEMASARARGAERIVLDVPLLLENDAEHGYAAECDVLIFVEVSQQERERRAQASRGWAAGEVARREAAQLPLDQKRRRADFVVSNEGTLAELEVAIRDILDAPRNHS